MSDFINIQTLENRLLAVVDELRTNIELTYPEYSGPVFGLIFLLYAKNRVELVKT